ncbi:TetR/AcrR family transcriptional regulator [Gordonia sp. PKS22-38]|uniref:TetR/AcrR family transcriptional regulator n=1 Tax=Gordonia prachuapensis TaxID=3115651 RepID=A0ABU7MZK4_9ACTN|nr:TetR/AcrR family transcriptional regulator [Gordonia sp. PKS22-38]
MARAYDSSGRERAAARTRERIVATARELLLHGGYAQMRVTDLAKAAEVSPQTIYNAIGGKAEVVKAVYDVMLAGDADETPMSERPEFLRLTAAGTIDEFAAAYAGWTRGIQERVGPLLGVLLEHGAAGDPILEGLVQKMNTERRQGNTNALNRLSQRVELPDGAARTRLIDAMWTLTGPAVYDDLVGRCNWSSGDYEQWLAAQLSTALRAR